MSSLSLVNVKKIYPFISGEEKKKQKKAKKGEQPDSSQQSMLDEHDGVIAEVRKEVLQMTAGVPLNKY